MHAKRLLASNRFPAWDCYCTCLRRLSADPHSGRVRFGYIPKTLNAPAPQQGCASTCLPAHPFTHNMRKSKPDHKQCTLPDTLLAHPNTFAQQNCETDMQLIPGVLAYQHDALRPTLKPCTMLARHRPRHVLGQRHSFGIMLRPCWHPVTTCQQQARLRFPPPGAAPSPGMTQTRRPRAAPPPPARRTGGAPSPTLSAPPAAPGAEYAGVTAQRIRYAVEEVERTRDIKRCAGACAPLASL